MRNWLKCALGVWAMLVMLGGTAHAAAGGGEVLWDRYGVAHVYAKTTDGLFYGYGWAQAKSHGDAVLQLYAEARGRASEIYGPSELKVDRWSVINGIPDRAKLWMKAQTPEFRGYLEAFAAGFDAYAKAHPNEFSAESKAVLPVNGTDVMAHALRLFQYHYIAGPAIDDRLPAISADPDGRGSNGWAIAPSRTASGHSMLLMNPHLPWPTGWSTYYEIQLKAPGIDLYGASQIGLPILRFMFSDYVGFTQTVNDVGGYTLYALTPAPGGYMFDGKVRPFETSTKTIKVRQPDGKLTSETVTIKKSIQGPVVAEKDGKPIALKVVGLDRPRALEQYWKMGTAHDFAGYKDALRMMQVPTFNVIYADRDGHIQYLFNGLVPKKPGRNLRFWRGIVPGDTSSTLWTDYLSYDELPKFDDPVGGTVQNSNDAPWNAAWPTLLDPKPYANQVTPELNRIRGERGIRMLSEVPKFTFDDLVKSKWSTRSELADRILPDLEEAVGQYGTPLAKQAVAVLARWDRTTQADSKGALLFLNWSDRKGAVTGAPAAGFAHAYEHAKPLTTPYGLADPKAAAAALDDAAKDMMAKWGSLDKPWGDVMRIRWGDKDLPASGGPNRLGIFDVLDFDKKHSADNGDTWVALVSFDGPAKAKVLLAYGNASQAGSPHIADQVPLLSKQVLRDAWRTRAEVEANLESRDAF